MSGIEVAASGITLVQLAPQVAKYIFQAYKLWGEIKNVPEDIHNLVTNLKAYEPIFCEIEARFDACAAQVNHGALKMSFDCARQAQMALEEMLRDLRTELDAKRGLKQKAAALKVIMKKAELEKLEKRLSQSLGLLQLALQMYQLALQSIANSVLQNINSDLFASSVASIVVEQLNEPSKRQADETQKEKDHNDTMRQTSVVPRPKEYSAAYSSSKIGPFAIKYAKVPGSWHAHIQLPRWLSESVYELRSITGVGGWTYTYRTYNIIPDNSEIFQRIRRGDKEGVLELFRTGKASPFDRDANGFSLLHEAALHVQPDLCHLFLNMGLEEVLDEPVGGGRRSPLSPVALEFRGPASRGRDGDTAKNRNLRQIIDLFRSFIRGPDAIPGERLLDFVVECAHGDEEVMAFLDTFMPSFYSRPLLLDRLEAIRLGAFNVLRSWTLLRLLSPDQIVTSADIDQSNHERLSLMHSAAIAFSSRYPEKLIAHKTSDFYWPLFHDGWAWVIEEIVRAAKLSYLHSVELVVPWDVYQVPVWKGTRRERPLFPSSAAF
ncbi:Uncharacterized protein TPAR_07535 [Tolypocladium paradoxum]|uniref:NACHT-NTPase and P-loop NTPases N-terminal domain-containing protein n=1 Tax=Tolypocladium paradoxum TaxID=94208 RepID=A0A2S4KPZ7_9HYPO|nr:Uncharacterized protein TPAR_07535 [Tolypocladium paradoxum]